MSARVRKFHPALKHGGFSVTGLLPGEDRVAFQKLYRDVIADLCPNGPLEDDIVEKIARLMWRKQNLRTVRMAELARKRYLRIRSEMVPALMPPFEFPNFSPNWTPPDPAEIEAAEEAAEARARKELGEMYTIVKMGDEVTIAKMLDDLSVEERLDSWISQQYKQLLFLRGLKSSTAAARPLPRSEEALPRIEGPKKVA